MTVQYARQDHLATLTLHRPEKLNAIDAPMQAALAAAWQRFEADDEAWVAILTGSGRAFCAGADRSWFQRIAAGEDGLGEFLAPVPQVDAPEARHAVEHAVAFGVIQVHALGLDDDPRTFRVQVLVVRKRMQVVLAVQLLPLGRGAVGKVRC